jgi:hypothetical protein
MATIDGALISPELAEFLQRQFRGELPPDPFRCPSCHQPVVTHARSKAPHFEHKAGSGSGCILRSDRHDYNKQRNAENRELLKSAKKAVQE